MRWGGYNRLEDTFVRAYPFPSPEHLELIDMAITLAYDLNVSDLDTIHMLGEGWVAEEALAIAVFCAVRYQDEAFDLNDLELSDVIETIAEDLYTATQKVVPKPGENKAWDRKYRR